jgi:hypothetical protein
VQRRLRRQERRVRSRRTGCVGLISTNRIGAAAATFTLGFAPFFLGIAPAHGEPKGCPKAAIVDDSACSGRFASATANRTDGTLNGTLVGGQSPITLSGPPDAYVKSTGFASSLPDPIQQWDATIDRVNNVNPSDPGLYGQGKAEAFLPRDLNDLAAQFPPDSIVIRFVPDETYPGWFRMLSIQPTA